MVSLEKLFFAGLLSVLVVGSYGLTYKFGMMSGAVVVSKEWQKDNKLRNDAVAEIKQEFAAKEALHKQKTQEVNDELAQATTQHAAALAALRADLTVRMQHSENRAGIYQRQSQGSAAERDRLAEHAAKLDRTIEEGRSLVTELGATVKQRDATIRALSIMVLNDRTLLTESSVSNDQ